MEGIPSRLMALLVAVILFTSSPRASFAKHDAKDSSDRRKESKTDTELTIEQLQNEINQIQKRLDKLAAAEQKARKEDAKERDDDYHKDKSRTSVAQSQNKSGSSAVGAKGQQTERGTGIMVPVSQLPPGIAKRFAGQKFAPASALPPGIAKKFTGRAAQAKKDEKSVKKEGDKKHDKDGGDDDDRRATKREKSEKKSDD
jgi:hypothetical protein